LLRPFAPMKEVGFELVPEGPLELADTHCENPRSVLVLSEGALIAALGSPKDVDSSKKGAGLSSQIPGCPREAASHQPPRSSILHQISNLWSPIRIMMGLWARVQDRPRTSD
jgi:hypothetical protein